MAAQMAKRGQLIHSPEMTQNRTGIVCAAFVFSKLAATDGAAQGFVAWRQAR